MPRPEHSTPGWCKGRCWLEVDADADADFDAAFAFGTELSSLFDLGTPIGIANAKLGNGAAQLNSKQSGPANPGLHSHRPVEESQ